MTTQNRLRDFVTELLNDPAKWQRCRTDPRGLIAEAKLSDQEKQLLQEGPAADLQKYLGGSTGFQTAVLCWDPAALR